MDSPERAANPIVFIDLVAGESLIKERAAARFNDLVSFFSILWREVSVPTHTLTKAPATPIVAAVIANSV